MDTSRPPWGKSFVSGGQGAGRPEICIALTRPAGHPARMPTVPNEPRSTATTSAKKPAPKSTPPKDATTTATPVEKPKG